MKTLRKIFLAEEPFKSPGRFIFWVGVDLAFALLAVTGFNDAQHHDNHAQMILNFVFGLCWFAWLYNDLDRWFLPKKFPEPVPAPAKANTLADEE